MTTLRDHLLARGCDPDAYHCHVDEVKRVATFMLYTLSGKLIGFQAYRPEAPKDREGKGFHPRDLKYFTYVTRSAPGLIDSVSLFGFERFDVNDRIVYLVEGIFDAVAIHNLGLNALAALGNVGKGRLVPLRAQLAALGMTTIAVEDGDASGSELGRHTHHRIHCPPGEDPASMPPDQLRQLLARAKQEL